MQTNKQHKKVRSTRTLQIQKENALIEAVEAVLREYHEQHGWDTPNAYREVMDALHDAHMSMIGAAGTDKAPGNGKLFMAQTDTRSFDWMGFGRTGREATNALLKCWRAHCSQLEKDGVYLDRSHIQADDVSMFEVEIGKGYRDGEEVLS